MMNKNLPRTPAVFQNMNLKANQELHSPRSGFSRPQYSTATDIANFGCFVERGRCDRRCTRLAESISVSSLPPDT
jgi:hypothetical protein